MLVKGATGDSIAFLLSCFGFQQGKHKRSALLAPFDDGIQYWSPDGFPKEAPVMLKAFSFHDVSMHKLIFKCLRHFNEAKMQTYFSVNCI